MTDYRALAQAGWDEYYAKDLDRLMARYTDDAEVLLPGAPPMQGKDAIRAVWEMYIAAFPDEHPTSMRHIVDGTTVVTEFSSVGTHSGPLPMPTGEMLQPTGRSVAFRGVAVADADGELIRRQVFYFDNLDVLTQLGVIPQPEGAAAG